MDSGIVIDIEAPLSASFSTGRVGYFGWDISRTAGWPILDITNLLYLLEQTGVLTGTTIPVPYGYSKDK